MKVTWSVISFILALILIFQLYIITTDYKVTNEKITNFISVSQYKLDSDSYFSPAIKYIVYDTSILSLLLEQREKLQKLKINYYNSISNFKDNKITYSPSQYILHLPKSLCINFMNLNQLNLNSEKINLISSLNIYSDQFKKIKDSLKTIFLAKISRNEFQRILIWEHHNRSQFIINSDTLDTNLGPFVIYENKLLNKYKNEVKLLMYSPVESDEIMNKWSKIFY
jgi:hypothetical protein